MAIVNIPAKNQNEAQAWCEKTISPQRYYVHTKFGGPGWEFRRISKTWDWELTIEDDQLATIAMLKFT